jgi:lactoylglutathione lyase
MIDTVGGTIVYVSDQSKALKFYTQKLEFDVKSDMSYGNNELRWIEVAPKNSKATISLVEPDLEFLKDEQQVERAEKRIGTDTDIWFYSNNIESTYEELKNNDVEITKPEKQDWGGVMCIFKDQDGNSYGLASTPLAPPTTT